MPDVPQFLYLTTQGRTSGQPREIEIWFTEHAGRYYVVAEYTTSNWVKNLQAHPEVKVRIDQESFPAEARILSPEKDAATHQTVAKLSQEKYGWAEGLIVELSPRK